MSDAIFPPPTATKNHEVYITDLGYPATCVVCADAAPWNCNRCSENVCNRHVLHRYHECTQRPAAFSLANLEENL